MKHCLMKSISLFLVVVMLSFAATSALAKDYKGAFYVNYLDGDNLNVRGNASSGDVEYQIKAGTVVQSLDNKDGWLKVRWWHGKDDLREGYVKASFLSSIDSDKDAVFKVVCSVYVHSTSKIKFGECALYHTGDKLKKGQRVMVLEQDGTWARVLYDGGSGWIPSIYLKRVS